jgi:hypothetical protein
MHLMTAQREDEHVGRIYESYTEVLLSILRASGSKHFLLMVGLQCKEGSNAP